MMISVDEGKAIMVALHRAAHDYTIKATLAIKGTPEAQTLAQFVIECKRKAAEIQHTRRIEIPNAAERDLIVAALRHTAQIYWEMAEADKIAREKVKRQHFSAAFGALADRIAEATGAPAPRSKLH